LYTNKLDDTLATKTTKLEQNGNVVYTTSPCHKTFQLLTLVTKKVQQMLSKLQFKEWFDRYKYAELAATTAFIMQSVKSVLIRCLLLT
jgi:hypothetical protein